MGEYIRGIAAKVVVERAEFVAHLDGCAGVMCVCVCARVCARQCMSFWLLTSKDDRGVCV